MTVQWANLINHRSSNFGTKASMEKVGPSRSSEADWITVVVCKVFPSDPSFKQLGQHGAGGRFFLEDLTWSDHWEYSGQQANRPTWSDFVPDLYRSSLMSEFQSDFIEFIHQIDIYIHKLFINLYWCQTTEFIQFRSAMARIAKMLKTGVRPKERCPRFDVNSIFP